MELIGKKVMLRKFKNEDIKEYYDWYTKSTEWQKWDAPWIKRKLDVNSIIMQKKSKNSTNPIMTFEIYSIDNKYIGWVNAYYIDEKCVTTNVKTEKLAIGLDIPEEIYRGDGRGTEALNLFTDY